MERVAHVLLVAAQGTGDGRAVLAAGARHHDPGRAHGEGRGRAQAAFQSLALSARQGTAQSGACIPGKGVPCPTLPSATAPGAGPDGEPGLQLTAFFTSSPILALSSAVNVVSAKAVGHMVPSSRFASSLKPSVAYLELNFCAAWK